MQIPPGFGTVAPYLFVNEANAYINFILEAFDCEEVGRSLGPDGQIANCQIRFGTATMMISEAGGRFPPSQSAFYLFVDDADSAMARSLECGATLVMEVMDMSYGDRQGGVTDPAGNIWWISQRLSPDPYF